MISVEHQGKTLLINGMAREMSYDILDAFPLNEKIIVLIDPDSYLRDPSYSKERRRGINPLRNLLAVSNDGTLLWEAELPEKVGHYYSISSREPLVANFSASYRCEIDAGTGLIRKKEFYK